MNEMSIPTLYSRVPNTPLRLKFSWKHQWENYMIFFALFPMKVTYKDNYDIIHSKKDDSRLRDMCTFQIELVHIPYLIS